MGVQLKTPDTIYSSMTDAQRGLYHQMMQRVGNSATRKGFELGLLAGACFVGALWAFVALSL